MDALPQAFRQGIDEFNRGYFFEAHDLWEELWREMSGPRAQFLQGLIQVAVALHHLRNGNLAGAQRLLAAGMEKLSGPVPEQEPLAVDALLAALAPLRKQISAGAIPTDWTAPQIQWKSFPIPSNE